MAWVYSCWFVKLFLLLVLLFHLISVDSNLLNQDFFFSLILLDLGLKLSILPMEISNHGLELAILGFDVIIRITFLNLVTCKLVADQLCFFSLMVQLGLERLGLGLHQVDLLLELDLELLQFLDLLSLFDVSELESSTLGLICF
jgi:hypothetical protein